MTVVSYQLSVASNVRIRVYDIVGRKVATLVEEKQTPGGYSVEWNAAGVASGMYFLRLEAGQNTASRKMILLK
jgi:hypothetical protein